MTRFGDFIANPDKGTRSVSEVEGKILAAGIGLHATIHIKAQFQRGYPARSASALLLTVTRPPAAASRSIVTPKVAPIPSQTRWMWAMTSSR